MGLEAALDEMAQASFILLLGHRAPPHFSSSSSLLSSPLQKNQNKTTKDKEPGYFHPSHPGPWRVFCLVLTLSSQVAPQQLRMPSVPPLVRTNLPLIFYFLISRLAFCFKDTVLKRSKTQQEHADLNKSK